MKYFDCFSALGRRAGKHPVAPWTQAEMLAEMERCRINGALVYSTLARETHPAVGNPIITEICKNEPRLFPCWVGMPHYTGEFPSPADLLKQMDDAGVRALKLFPVTYWHGVDELALGELLAALEEAGIPVIFDRGVMDPDIQIGWDELKWVCEKYPKLPVLLHALRWESTRLLTPIAMRYDNLHFEFSNYQGNRMLEYWTRTIGHERLLFGTQALEKSMGAARAYVDYADLSQEQKAAIASGNLLRLLKMDEQLLPDYSGAPAPDKIVEKSMAGSPIDDSIVIDSHAHIIQKGGQGAERVTMPEGDAAGVAGRNRKLGVSKTCVSAWTAIWSDYELGNEDTILGMKELPDEIIGYAALDPNYIVDWDKTLNFYYKENNFKGMKPYHPRMQRPYNDPAFEPWWEFGNEHHLFALMHPSDNFHAEMLDLGSRFPNITFLLAHSGWTWKTAETHVDLAERFDNCFLEITFTSVVSGIIEFMVEKVGAHRVLYGSDAPMRDPYPQYGWVAYADISEADKRLILGENMEKILAKVKL